MSRAAAKASAFSRAFFARSSKPSGGDRGTKKFLIFAEPLLSTYLILQQLAAEHQQGVFEEMSGRLRFVGPATNSLRK